MTAASKVSAACIVAGFGVAAAPAQAWEVRGAELRADCNYVVLTVDAQASNPVSADVTIRRLIDHEKSSVRLEYSPAQQRLVIPSGIPRDGQRHMAFFEAIDHDGSVIRQVPYQAYTCAPDAPPAPPVPPVPPRVCVPIKLHVRGPHVLPRNPDHVNRFRANTRRHVRWYIDGQLKHRGRVYRVTSRDFHRTGRPPLGRHRLVVKASDGCGRDVRVVRHPNNLDP